MTCVSDLRERRRPLYDPRLCSLPTEAAAEDQGAPLYDDLRPVHAAPVHDASPAGAAAAVAAAGADRRRGPGRQRALPPEDGARPRAQPRAARRGRGGEKGAKVQVRCA